MNHRTVFAALMVLGLAPVVAHAQGLANSYSVVDLKTSDVAGHSDLSCAVGATRPTITSPRQAYYWDAGQCSLISLSGYRESYATAISSNNIIIGSAVPIGSYTPKGFVISGGQVSWLPTLGGTLVTPNGVNDAGQVVGGSSLASGLMHAFVFSGGQMTDLGTLGGPTSSAAGINNSGQVVGTSRISYANGISRAFLFSNGRMSDLGTFVAGSNSAATAINDNGAVVGWATGAAGPTAFYWASGRLTALANTYSFAYGLNNAGLAVGTMQLPGVRTMVGFAWQNGSLVDLNSRVAPGSGWVITAAKAVNDNGEIVATGTKNGLPGAVLLRPVR